jgi:hypothetical protein
VKPAQGKTDEAVHALQDLADKNPKVLAYRYQLANIEASAALQAMKSNPAREKILCRQASDNYKEILKSAASSSDTWLRFGVMQRELGEPEPR